MTNQKLYRVLLHIAMRSYPGDYIEPFHVEMIQKEIANSHGEYRPKTKTIVIHNLYRSTSAIMVTAIHELGHHIEWHTKKSGEHSKYFYRIVWTLISTATELGYIDYEEAKKIHDSTTIEEMEKLIGPVCSMYDEKIDINKNNCTVIVKNSYVIKDLLSKKGYSFNKIERLWEKDMKRDKAEADKEEFVEAESHVIVFIKKITDLTMDVVYQLTLRGDTYPIKDKLLRAGYYFAEDKHWHKFITASTKNKELKFLSQFKGLQIKIST